VFKTKKVTIGKQEKLQHYDKIIEQIKNSKAGDMSLVDSLKFVATEDVVNYISTTVEDYKIKQRK